MKYLSFQRRTYGVNYLPSGNRLISEPLTGLVKSNCLLLSELEESEKWRERLSISGRLSNCYNSRSTY